jgi:hypothetical protein
MDRGNHYEAAFEAYLRDHGYCYVAVDESRRALLGDARVKNLDFIVYGEADSRLLVDVKGRRFPSGSAERPRRVWECWSTQDDIDGLQRWTSLFGVGYQGVLVFAFQMFDEPTPLDDVSLCWQFRGRTYLFQAVDVLDYRRHMRVRSPKWGTVGLPGPIFRSLVQPVHHFLRSAAAVVEECPF